MPAKYEEACYNLRLYLSQAVLPNMPLGRGCPTVQQHARIAADTFLLSPEPDSRRKLRTVLHLIPRVVNKKIEAFLQKQIPNRPVLGASDYAPDRPATFHIPAEAFTIPYFPPARMRDMRSMSGWMDMPLLTTERVMRVVWPEQTKGFCLTTQKINADAAGEDSEIYKAYYWKKCRGVNQDDVHQTTCKLLIAALAPWALSPRDMDDFMRIGQMPAFSMARNSDERPTYNRAQKVWAKLWDDCTRKRCPYFAVSVYHGWIFGVFVKGWTMALISEAIRHTDVNPTVLQWLVFWMAASMEIPGTWVPPQLKRFGNPDITDASRVATKLSPLLSHDFEQEEMVTHAEWLDKNHKVDDKEKGGETIEWNAVTNTWVTVF